MAIVRVTVYVRCTAGNSMMMLISDNRLNLYTIHIFWVAQRESDAYLQEEPEGRPGEP